MKGPRAPATALVTGGAGFVGSHLAERLVADGCEVTALDDLSTGSLEHLHSLDGRPGFRFVEGTVTSEATLEPLLSECDVVFHLAAPVGVELILRDPIRVIEESVGGIQAVLRCAQRQGKKVLVASSSEIYGKNEQVPFSEDADRLLGSTANARWSYSTAKAVSEYLSLAYHRSHGLEVVIFRLFNTIGPRQSGAYGMVVPRLAAQAVRGETLTVFGDGRQTRCFCDVRDAVRAIADLATCPAAVGRSFNIGSEEEVTILDLARRLLALAAGDGHGDPAERIALIPYDSAYEPGFEDMRRRRPNLARIRGATGWRPRIPLDDTLRSVLESVGESLTPRTAQLSDSSANRSR